MAATAVAWKRPCDTGSHQLRALLLYVEGMKGSGKKQEVNTVAASYGLKKCTQVKQEKEF